MESTIIGAIIGAISALIAAIIGVLKHKQKIESEKHHFEKSKSLKLGYISAAIECYLEAQKLGVTSDSLSSDIEVQIKRAHEIGKILGISTNSNHNLFLKELFILLETKPITIKKTFKIGYTIGRIYFFSISLMANGSIPPIDEDVKRISEAEQLLEEANLPSDFLKPVKNLWWKKLKAIRKGDTQPIDVQMEGILDQLCNSIEIDT